MVSERGYGVEGLGLRGEESGSGLSGFRVRGLRAHRLSGALVLMIARGMPGVACAVDGLGFGGCRT